MGIQAVEGGGLSLKELCSRRCISSLSLPLSLPSLLPQRYKLELCTSHLAYAIATGAHGSSLD